MAYVIFEVFCMLQSIFLENGSAGSCFGPLQISSFFMSNNPQVNLYKYNLGTPHNYCTTVLNLYKYDLATEPLQV